VKRDQGQYAMGKKDGANVSFYNNGQKRSEELWENGELVTVQLWKTDGEKCPETTLIAGTGKHVWYHYHRGEKWQEVTYVDGLKQGAETTYRDDGNKLWTVEPWGGIRKVTFSA
jgi:antitoxin component YwqK of YwqJK toxin-antitoxin module